MRTREPRWQKFIKAAVSDTGPDQGKNKRGQSRRRIRDLRRRIVAVQEQQAEQHERQRADIRLLPSVIAMWGVAAMATTSATGRFAPGLVLLPLSMALLAVVVIMRRQYGHNRRVRTARLITRVPLSMSGTLLLAALCSGAVLGVAGLRIQSVETSSLGALALTEQELLIMLQVSQVPRPLAVGNGPPRVIFDAVILEARASGRRAQGRLEVRVVAASHWAGVHPGQMVTTAGTLHRGQGADGRVPSLRPTTAPINPAPPQKPPGSAGSQPRASPVAAIRTAWISAVDRVWQPHAPDVAALLPGMVMGERSAMDSSLSDAMKVVGLTHLTAVSGANCTLVLAALMLVLRSLRLPRLLTFTGALASLGAFVIVVGPDPSVLRAAVMGSIGAMAVLGGRPKRVGVFLCLSIMVLLLADPWLATDYAFILSVLATLGLLLVGQRCVLWLSVPLPLWLAQSIAIPLAAQLFCAPVIVLLQAQLTPYTVLANMVVAPVIVLVTTVGTLGLTIAVPLPALGLVCAAVSGTGAWWVAIVARWMAGLPAASLPWPEGLPGVFLMACLNALMLLALVALVERQRVAVLLERIPDWWRKRFGFATLVALAATMALGWTAAVVHSS